MMLTSVFVVSLLVVETIFVSGLNFTLSEPRVVLGTTGKLLMICHVTETDVSTVYNIQIRRETSSGWKTLAIIEAGDTEIRALDKNSVVANGTLDKETPLNTYLTLEMDVEKMTYGDSRHYRCELTYKSNITDDIILVNTNVTLLIDEANNKTDRLEEANNKTDGGAVTKQSTDCDSESNTTITVGAILGVTNILTILYAIYLTVVIKRSRGRSFDDGSFYYERRGLEPKATDAKRDLHADPHSYSVNDDQDTYELSK